MSTAQMVVERLHFWEAESAAREQTSEGPGLGRMPDHQVLEQPIQLENEERILKKSKIFV
jgi:hypothetical protein